MSIQESVAGLETAAISQAFNGVFYESFLSPKGGNSEVEENFRDAYPALSEVLEKTDMYYQLVAPERRSQSRHVRAGMLLGFLVVDRLARIHPELKLQIALQHLDGKKMEQARSEVLMGIIAQDQVMPALPAGLAKLGDYSAQAFKVRLTTHNETQREELELGFAGALYILQAGSTKEPAP